MRKSEAALLAALSFAVPAGAVETLPLTDLAGKTPVLNVFDLDPSKPLPRKGGLLELKWHELRREYPACRDMAARLQNTSKDLEGWIVRVRVDCALRANDKKKDLKSLSAAVSAVKPSLLREGPWKDGLRDLWYKGGVTLMQGYAKSSPDEVKRVAELLLQTNDVLSREQRAEILNGLADAVAATKDFGQALFFLKQSQDLSASPSLQARIADLESKVKARPDAPAAPAASAQELGAEAEADAQVQTFFAEGRRSEAVRKMVEILNRFPSGRSAKRYKDRVLEVLVSSADKGDGDESGILAAAKEADASRLGEWAASLHRRGADRAAGELAEKALETSSASPTAATLLWIAGRAASFQGDDDRAALHFDRLVQFHSSADESAEALFRLGLIQVRRQNFATAAKLFEKLIAQNKPRWDLNARYWRVRSLEKTDKPRFEAEREDLLRRSPFTYYGLRLRAERDGGILEYPKSDRSPLEASPASLWLVGAQKQSWQRFKKLSAEGWILEAQAELALLPAPQDPWALLQWARMLAKAGQYPTAILLLNRATDQDESLRHPRYLTEFFPRAYGRWVDEEARKNGLDPVLVRSLIRQESAYGLRAVSTSNAMGLMQLIPPTAQEVARDLKMDVVIPDDMFRPEVNVPMGTSYIARMVRDFGGTVPFALAAYNAGPTRLNRWLKQRPALWELKGKDFSGWQDEVWYDELPWTETSFYVKAILRNVLLDRLIDQGRVAVGPAFWADLRASQAKVSDDEVKRR